MDGVSALINETTGSRLVPPATWGPRQKTAVFEAGSRLPPGTESPGALIRDIPASRAVRSTRWCLPATHLWCSAKAAQMGRRTLSQPHPCPQSGRPGTPRQWRVKFSSSTVFVPSCALRGATHSAHSRRPACVGGVQAGHGGFLTTGRGHQRRGFDPVLTHTTEVKLPEAWHLRMTTV